MTAMRGTLIQTIFVVAFSSRIRAVLNVWDLDVSLRVRPSGWNLGREVVTHEKSSL